MSRRDDGALRLGAGTRVALTNWGPDTGFTFQVETLASETTRARLLHLRADTAELREAIRGQEVAITALVAGLVRESIEASIAQRASLAEQEFARAHEVHVARYANLRPLDLGDGAAAVQRREAATAAAVKRWKQRAHVVPVALIQFFDFTSDIFVLVELARGGGPQWIVGVSAMGGT